MFSKWFDQNKKISYPEGKPELTVHKAISLRVDGVRTCFLIVVLRYQDWDEGDCNAFDGRAQLLVMTD